MSLYKVAFYNAFYNREKHFTDTKQIKAINICQSELPTVLNYPQKTARKYGIKLAETTYIIPHYDVTEYVYNPIKNKLQLDYAPIISGTVF